MTLTSPEGTAMPITMLDGDRPCTTHHGLVLGVWERNGYDDSDFYAAAWNNAEQRVEAIVYATTRWWTYRNGAEVDATPEVVAKAERWLAGVIEARLLAAEQHDAADPTVGKRVRVTTTRGRHIGKVGIVRRREANRYRTFYPNGANDPTARHLQRVALEVQGEDRWVWVTADKVLVVNPRPPDQAEIRARAAQLATHHRWMAAFP
jgi:hypothetical protein